MNKEELLQGYKKQEDRICLSQVLEKVEKSRFNERLESTNFLDMYQISLVEGFLKKNQISNYILYGGYENAERKVLIIYPEKYTTEMIEKNYDKLINLVRIELNVNDTVKLTHRNYLGAIVKLGLSREKVGDIVVDAEKGADVITIKEFSTILEKELSDEERFNNARITIEEIASLKIVESVIEQIKIIIPSFRLDNIVSDLIRSSRSKAVDVINAEKVFVNGKSETKQSKLIKENDVITIRGKGRFTIKNIEGTTRSGRSVVIIEKFA